MLLRKFSINKAVLRIAEKPQMKRDVFREL